MPPPRWRWGLQYVPFGWVPRKHPWGAAPRCPACPAGVPISPEKWGERGPGASPLDPRFLWPLVPTRWVWGWLALVRSKGCCLRYAKTNLGRIFEGKYAGKHFCEKRFPNQAHLPKAFPSGGRCPSAHTGADEGATGLPNGAGEERRRGDRSLLLQGKVGYRIAPSSVTFGDSFPPRGSLRRCYTPATQFILARPLLPQNANPNQGTYMGTVIAPLPEQCATTAKTSEWERAGPKPGGPGGLPPALFLLISREKWGPPPGRRGPRGAAPQGCF